MSKKRVHLSSCINQIRQEKEKQLADRVLKKLKSNVFYNKVDTH